MDRKVSTWRRSKDSQLLLPLFEFSEPAPAARDSLLRLMTSLFGDRAILRNATGCSSITRQPAHTPYCKNTDARPHLVELAV